MANAKISYLSETELRIMSWTMGILGGVCFAALLLFVLIQGLKKMGEEAHRKSILEAIVKEYFIRRQNGETTDQIADSLYKQIPISRPVEFSSGYYNPIPIGKLDFSSLMSQIPEEGMQLSKIAYTILCNRGVYPMPQQGQARRDSHCEFAAMTGILNECVAQLRGLEAAGEEIDQDLVVMVNKWAEVVIAIASRILKPSR